MGIKGKTNGSNIDPEKTALIIVDMQNDFIEEGAPFETPNGRKFADKLSKFIDKCRERGVLIVYTATVFRPSGADMGAMANWAPVKNGEALIEGTHGSEIHETVRPKEEDVVIKKHRYSGFYGTDLEIILRGRNIENVIITGVTTENCCAMTAREAQFRDYNVIFLTDLTATFGYPDQGFGEKSAPEIHETICTIIGTSVGQLDTSKGILERFKRN